MSCDGSSGAHAVDSGRPPPPSPLSGVPASAGGPPPSPPSGVPASAIGPPPSPPSCVPASGFSGGQFGLSSMHIGSCEWRTSPMTSSQSTHICLPSCSTSHSVCGSCALAYAHVFECTRPSAPTQTAQACPSASLAAMQPSLYATSLFRPQPSYRRAPLVSHAATQLMSPSANVIWLRKGTPRQSAPRSTLSP